MTNRPPDWNKRLLKLKQAIDNDEISEDTSTMIRQCGKILNTPIKIKRKGELSESRKMLIVLWNAGCNRQEIANELGWSIDTLKSTVRRLRKKGYDLKDRSGPQKQTSASRRQKLIKLWNAGVHIEKIMWLTGYKRKSVYSTVEIMRNAGHDVAIRRHNRVLS